MTQPFPNTHWSLVRRAGLPDETARREALKTLLERYLPALRSFLRGVHRMPDDDTEELLQAFIAERILEHGLISQADESKGRFRTLLLTSLRNFAVSRYRSQRVRTTSSLTAFAPIDNHPTADFLAQVDWARTLINGVLATMQTECQHNGRQDVWLVFEERVLAGIRGVRKPIAYDLLAQRLHLPTPTSAANLLVTAKRMYERLLRSAVAEYVRNPADIDEEIRDLRRILAESQIGPNHPQESE
jgi:hypothetical protein